MQLTVSCNLPDLKSPDNFTLDCLLTSSQFQYRKVPLYWKILKLI